MSESPEIVESDAVVKRAITVPSTQGRLRVSDVVKQMKLIQDVMRKAMRDGEDYGLIPGCGPKPSLLKPGAEKLLVLFRLAPKFTLDERDLGNGHREIRTVCDLYHLNTGEWFGQGVGSCSTLEAKYRWRIASRICPHCKKDAVIKGREEYGGGWLCFKKKEGCGAKWNDGAPEIEGQEVGRVENPDIADQYNTVLKMSQKRAQSAAVLTATGASSVFTQDIEDLPRVDARGDPEAHGVNTLRQDGPRLPDSQEREGTPPAPSKKISTESILAGRTESSTSTRPPTAGPGSGSESRAVNGPQHLFCPHGQPVNRFCQACSNEVDQQETGPA